MLLLLLYRIIGIMVREISQEPYHHRAHQDNSAHLLEILSSLLPCVSEDRLRCRNTIWRKLHYEREVIILEEAAHHFGGEDGQDDAEGVEPEEHQAGIAREERARYEYVHRHSACT